MKTELIIFVILIIIAIGLIAVFVRNRQKEKALLYGLKTMPHEKSDLPDKSKFVHATINDKTYALEPADTSEKRKAGLMNRSELSENHGMLFTFDRLGIYPIWMQNTLIPLDIIWLNTEKEVVHIKQNAKPCENTINAVCKSEIPTRRAKYVVELNAGQVNKANIEIGDKFEF